jgi:hypothetical protein
LAAGAVNPSPQRAARLSAGSVKPPTQIEWCGPLNWSEREPDVVQFEESALHSDGFARGKTADDSKRFVGPRSTLVERNPEPLRTLQPCSPDAEFEMAAGNDINHGEVFGQADWVVKGQQQHAEWNANSFGTGCDCACHREHRGQVAIVNEVMLGEPYVIEPMVLGPGYLIENFAL